MTKALIMFVALFFLLPVSNSHAAVLSTELAKYALRTPEDLQFACTPGHAPNGHNYPTDSDFQLRNLDFIFTGTNVRGIWAADPKGRLGNYCKELKQEFSSVLPADLVLKRTFSEELGWLSGKCMKTVVEKIEATVGPYQLEGSAYFNLGEVHSGCRP